MTSELTAAAQAAAAARRAGASSDELFAAAREAYNTATLPAGVMGGTSLSAGPRADAADWVIRPSARGVLALCLVGILVVGIGAVIVRSGVASVVPVIGFAAVVMAIWYALSLRSSVRIAGDSVYVQGVLHRREFRRLDVRQITVQPRSDSWALSTVPCEVNSSHRSWATTSRTCSICVRERGRGRMSTESALRLASR